MKKIDIPGYPVGCAIHSDNDFYISDHGNHCIYLINKELNIIKTFGSEGSCMDQFIDPLTIFCQNEYLFVSDSGNKRIQIFTLDLNYHDTIQLNFHPLSIAVSSTTIGIEGSDKTYFYDIKTKILKKEYPKIDGRISLIDSNFYVAIYKQPKKFVIFDQEGELIDECSVESISEHIQYHRDGFMFSTEDYLFVSSFSGGNVLKFNL